MNLFESVKSFFNESTLLKVADIIDAQPERVEQAIDITSKAIVGSLLKRISSETGMNLVYNTIQKNEVEIGQIREEEFSKLAANGDKILNIFLPSTKGPISSLIAKITGMRNPTVSSIVGFTTLAVANILKKQATEKNYDASELASYLGDQRQNLLNHSPQHNESLIRTIGLQSVLNNFSVPQTSAEDNTKSTSRTQNFLTEDDGLKEKTDFAPFIKWGLVGLGIVGAIATGFYFWNQQSTTTLESTEENTTNLNEARIIKEPVVKDTTAKISLKDSTKKISSNIFEAYLADTTKPKGKTLKFDKVDFIDNTPQLKPESVPAVNELLALLKKYPTAEIKFIDYANDAQAPNTNKVLSVKRAFALKQAMIDGSISFVRVDTEGRGSGLNPKDTTGRKQTPIREVYVKFVKK